MNESAYSFEQWLQQTIVKLDQELEQLAQIDERLRSHLTSSSHSSDSAEKDAINQLLSEIRSKAQTLRFYRELNFFPEHSRSSKNRDIVLSREAIQQLLIQHDAQVQKDPWQAIQLHLQPPYFVEHEGISIGITNLELSAQTIRLAFSLEGTVSLEEGNGQEDISVSTNEWPGALPVLAGIQLEDDLGTIYTVEPPPFFQLPRGKKAQWRMNSYMTFSGAVPQQLQALYFVVQSFMLLPSQVFLVAAKEPLIIHGPWKFTFLSG